MIVLMEPVASQLERMEAGDHGLPRWFAAPLAAAASGDFAFSRSLPSLLRSGWLGKAAEPALVFNVGPLEAALALLPTRLRLACLYQWPPPEQLGTAKRFIYKRLLAKSELILAYSRATQAELVRRFPGTPVRWIGLFTDTEFFGPARSQAPPEDFILCPGDHLRIEPVVSFLARELGVRVVRFSTSPAVAAYHRENPNPYVECLSGIPFSKVRDLYKSARLVLNAADDRYWPVGITTFCEALAMDKLIVTSGGHSCSGYEFEDGSKPYFTVRNCYDQREWLGAVRLALCGAKSSADGQSPRDLALRLCSFDATMAGWKAALEILDR